MNKKPAFAISREEMIQAGGKTMFQSAVELAAQGITSLPEALGIKHLD
jgi:type II secretory ATPase GspE/PulE/Tfp pilus assembly ATPase PilB-like protein